MPSLATETRIVDGVQAVGPPRQVSRTKTSPAPFVSPATRLPALDLKTTKRPSALMVGTTLAPLPWVPSLATDTRAVEGVQPADAPKQVSRTKMSRNALVSPTTRLLASESKPTNRPSELSAGRLSEPIIWFP